MISSINKPDYYIVSLLHVFEYTFIYDSAPTAHRRLIVIVGEATKGIVAEGRGRSGAELQMYNSTTEDIAPEGRWLYYIYGSIIVGNSS